MPQNKGVEISRIKSETRLPGEMSMSETTQHHIDYFVQKTSKLENIEPVE